MNELLFSRAALVLVVSFAGPLVLLGAKTPENKISTIRPLLKHALEGVSVIQTLQKEARLRTAKRDCLIELPAVLDVVTLGLAAGLSFDASLELYCNNYETSMSALFKKALLSWRMGLRSRHDELQLLSNQLELAAFESFIEAVDQSLEFGSPLSDVLVRQADLIRDQQRLLIEEEIEKAPVKMLIPLGTLIVPAMLLAILGPLVAGGFAIAG